MPLLSPTSSRSRSRARGISPKDDPAPQTKKLNNSKVAPIISKATLISKTNSSQAASVKPSSSSLGFKPYTISPGTLKTTSLISKAGSSNFSKDNRKNEEKLKQKAEKEAKKEEKRQAKEAEKLAKLRAKEIKKCGESKALLVA